jgi:hypothetical protein
MTGFTPHEWHTAAVAAYARCGGVFVGADTGTGKTWAAAEIARRCRRPLVVAPASAIPQTRKQFESYGLETRMSKDPYRAREGQVTFASYTWLTRKEQEHFIRDFAPSDILMDEFHEARGLQNSARKRIERYLMADSSVRVGVFTASPMSRDVTDMAFGLRWALRSRVDGIVPRTDSGLEALAERMAVDPEYVERWRAALLATDGVFMNVEGGQYQGDVVIRVVRRDPVLTLPDTWELPDGYLIESPAYAAVVARQMAYGYWPSVQPRPSQAYLDARRAWYSTVRRITESGAGIDTEAQVREVRPDEYARWARVEAAEGELAEPRPVWDPEAWNYLRRFAEMVPEHDADPEDGASIIWAHHRALQDKMAYYARAPLFREGGMSGEAGYLPKYRGPVAVASIEACHQSLNLQHFNHNLVLEPPSDPEMWRQLIGRTARQGQTAPAVYVDVVVNSPYSDAALRTALARARSTMQTTGKSNHLLQLENQDW